MTFTDWLANRNIDQQTLEPELLAALRSQFEREQPTPSVLVIPETTDQRWATALWLPRPQ